MSSNKAGSPYPSTVVDERGETFELEDEPLGEGGQGIVVRARNSDDVVVKLCSLRGTGASAAKKRLRRHLEEVRLLPVDGLQLARPMEMLRGGETVGYTMRMLRDMVPIGELITTSGKDNLVEFYLEGGGLRRRLRLLEKAASTLAKLHSTPLVYGDVSAQNVFVSESTEADEVWFIDSDNLTYAGQTSSGIYTPMFGAPELVTGHSRANTTVSDVYSFAILAFWVLVQSHPFLGEAVESGGWDETSTDREAEAMEGEFPYIDDPEDDSNLGIHGFSGALGLVFSKTLRRLFQQVFTQGRKDPLSRPKVAEFAESFRRAGGMTVHCSQCSSTYYVTAGSCPWCEAEESRPDVIFVQARRWDPRLDDEDWKALFASNVVYSRVIEVGESATLRRHTVAAVPARLDNEPELKIEFQHGGVSVERLSDREFWLVTDNTSEPVRLVGSKVLPMPEDDKRWHLHCGPLDKPHRLLSFQLFSGARP